MDSRLSGIERFIIFLSVKKKRKFYFNVFTHKWIRTMREYIKIKFSLPFQFFTPKKIMNRSIPLRRESIQILSFCFKKKLMYRSIPLEREFKNILLSITVQFIILYFTLFIKTH